MSLIEFNQVSKTYGSFANQFNPVNNLTFKLEQGEFLGIMGPSGAGKSTILNMAAALDFPTSGSVLLNDLSTIGYKESELAKFRKQEMGFIFQDFSLLDNLTAQENIILPLLAQRLSKKVIAEKVVAVAKKLLINDVLDRYPNELSVGQRQRIAAARAIIKEPKIIFADEPTGSLDSRSATELLQFLQSVNEIQKTTVLMVTHDPFTASYCQRIIFIKDGRIFAELNRSQSRQEFFDKILQMQAAIGGRTQ